MVRVVPESRRKDAGKTEGGERGARGRRAEVSFSVFQLFSFSPFSVARVVPVAQSARPQTPINTGFAGVHRAMRGGRAALRLVEPTARRGRSSLGMLGRELGGEPQVPTAPDAGIAQVPGTTPRPPRARRGAPPSRRLYEPEGRLGTPKGASLREGLECRGPSGSVVTEASRSDLLRTHRDDFLAGLATPAGL